MSSVTSPPAAADEELDHFMVVPALCDCKTQGTKRQESFRLSIVVHRVMHATSILIEIGLYLYCRLASNSIFSTLCL